MAPEPGTRLGRHDLAADDFRALVESGQQPIVVLGAAGEIRYGSPAWATLLGGPLEGFQGSSLLDRLAPDSVEMVGTALEHAVAGKAPVRLTLQLRLEDGPPRSITATVAPFRDSVGNAGAVLRCDG